MEGIYILKNRVKGNNRSCWVHNTSKTPVQLKRQAMIAQVSEPDKKVVAVWSIKEKSKMPSEAKETKEMPSDAKRNKGREIKKEKPSVAKQNNKRKGKST